ncbi:porin family protein [Salinimonas iocasae]|uniref:Porin family protein n=1 Tax=Salinimonas iocasae TaxID=2572577 RepID=A0A5B7YC61_9ALTE|nr:porin family protein [Salinimonas iocasae]QCZ92833.1 porin family protein [Salinimonas iocasae]
MQRNTFAALVLAGCAFSSSVAVAADNIYLGGNISRQTIDVGGRDFNVFSVLAGYKFSDYWSLETRLGTGLSDYTESYEFGGSSYLNKEEIDWQASVNIRGAYPVTHNLSVFGVVGYSETEIDRVSREDDSVRFSGSFEDTTGVSYGAGLNYHISDNISATLEYQVLPELSGFDWDSLALGVQYHF